MTTRRMREFAPGEYIPASLLGDPATMPLTNGGFLAFVEEADDQLRRDFDDLERQVRERLTTPDSTTPA